MENDTTPDGPAAEFDTSPLPELSAFAAANGLHYEPAASAPHHGGALFEYLQDAAVTDRFTTPDGRLEVGTVEGVVGGSQSRTSGNVTVTTSYSTTTRRSYGYVALRLETMLPHFVLDATRNNRTFGSSIPMPIAGGQTLSLEGDFDSHFTLHCPQGYERDALYVFTPDLMALLIDINSGDGEGDLDVEIVDDMLYLYANAPFRLADASLWQRLQHIVTVIGSKALRQTTRYRDDREEPGGGRRLQQGFLGAPAGGGAGRLGWVVIVVVAGVIVVFAVIGTVVFTALRSAFGG